MKVLLIFLSLTLFSSAYASENTYKELLTSKATSTKNSQCVNAIKDIQLIQDRQYALTNHTFITHKNETSLKDLQKEYDKQLAEISILKGLHKLKDDYRDFIKQLEGSVWTFKKTYRKSFNNIDESIETAEDNISTFETAQGVYRLLDMMEQEFSKDYPIGNFPSRNHQLLLEELCPNSGRKSKCKSNIYSFMQNYTKLQGQPLEDKLKQVRNFRKNFGDDLSAVEEKLLSSRYDKGGKYLEFRKQLGEYKKSLADVKKASKETKLCIKNNAIHFDKENKKSYCQKDIETTDKLLAAIQLKSKAIKKEFIHIENAIYQTEAKSIIYAIDGSVKAVSTQKGAYLKTPFYNTGKIKSTLSVNKNNIALASSSATRKLSHLNDYEKVKLNFIKQKNNILDKVTRSLRNRQQFADGIFKHRGKLSEAPAESISIINEMLVGKKCKKNCSLIETDSNGSYKFNKENLSSFLEKFAQGNKGAEAQSKKFNRKVNKSTRKLAKIKKAISKIMASDDYKNLNTLKNFNVMLINKNCSDKKIIKELKVDKQNGPCLPFPIANSGVTSILKMGDTIIAELENKRTEVSINEAAKLCSKLIQGAKKKERKQYLAICTAPNAMQSKYINLMQERKQRLEVDERAIKVFGDDGIEIGETEYRRRWTNVAGVAAATSLINTALPMWISNEALKTNINREIDKGWYLANYQDMQESWMATPEYQEWYYGNMAASYGSNGNYFGGPTSFYSPGTSGPGSPGFNFEP